MNIEEIKAISEIIAGLANTGEQVGTSWLLAHYGLGLIKDLTSTLVGLALIYAVYRVAFIAKVNEEAEEFLIKARDQLKTGSWGSLTEREMHDTIRALEGILKEKRDKS